MDRYPEDLNEWPLDFVKELVEEEHEENAFLEYKSSLKDGEKQKLEREFTAFSNGKGGFIVFGVKDDHSICGIEIPEDEELTQYIKEMLTNTNPVVQFQVGDPIMLSEDSDRGILVVKIEESNKKPVATGDSAYYIRMGESKQPIDREHLMTLFVHRDKQQENRRILEMEINRFCRIYEEDLDEPYLEGNPPYHKVDTDVLRDAIRQNNWLYSNEETRKEIDAIFDKIQEIEDMEERFIEEKMGRLDINRPKRKRNIRHNRELGRLAGILKSRLEKLKEKVGDNR